MEGRKEEAAVATERYAVVCSIIIPHYYHDDNIAESVGFVCPLAFPAASLQKAE